MFTVVIPVFNKHAYIEKCLLSVLGQTFKDFEIVVVDDGSNDNSLEIVKRIEQKVNNEKRIVKSEEADVCALDSRNTIERKFRIISQENRGVSAARNNGAKTAKHDYIAFLDADDWWDNHFLEEMKGLIERYTGAGLYGSNYYYVKNGFHRLENKGLKNDFTSGYVDYIKIYSSTFCVPINCSFVVVPKVVFFEAGGFNQELKFGEDFELWIRLALKYKVVYLNKPLAYSNQDLPDDQRATGYKKLYHPTNHFIFNLGYLNEKEKVNPELKTLLDGLRLRSLQSYHLEGLYTNEVNTELAKVDFEKQSVYYRVIYNSPKLLVISFFSLRKAGSKIKQYFFKKFKSHFHPAIKNYFSKPV